MNFKVIMLSEQARHRKVHTRECHSYKNVKSFLMTDCWLVVAWDWKGGGVDSEKHNETLEVIDIFFILIRLMLLLVHTCQNSMNCTL